MRALQELNYFLGNLAAGIETFLRSFGFLHPAYVLYHPISFYRDRVNRKHAIGIACNRILISVALLAAFSWFPSHALGDIYVFSLLATLIPIVVTFFLGPFAFVSSICMMISWPLFLILYILFAFYRMAGLDRVFPDSVMEHILDWSSDIFLVVLFSTLATTWVIIRANIYMRWSVAKLVSHTMHVLASLPVVPLITSVIIWAVSDPLSGYINHISAGYVPDLTRWIRLIAAAIVVLSVPMMILRVVEKATLGIDQWNKGRRTDAQNVYGNDGFASPRLAASAMSNPKYE